MRLLYLLYCTTYWLLYYTFARRRSRRSTPMRSRAKSMTITFLRARCVRKCKCVCVCVCVCYFMCVICKERERVCVSERRKRNTPLHPPNTQVLPPSGRKARSLASMIIILSLCFLSGVCVSVVSVCLCVCVRFGAGVDDDPAASCPVYSYLLLFTICILSGFRV